eukprot:2086545-Prymnesium_polylepis.1
MGGWGCNCNEYVGPTSCSTGHGATSYLFGDTGGPAFTVFWVKALSPPPPPPFPPGNAPAPPVPPFPPGVAPKPPPSTPPAPYMPAQGSGESYAAFPHA